ncbi:hypothetical protein [Magnetovibrio sp.]|uniref:hypothetical protein n=1 Tax=Magnetovibrio sp. TaxID=2024836 RepID=UPI002F9295B5
MAEMNANMGKAAWPKTPDGTTDWEVVFEDPQSGFVQLIAQSPSAETLRLTTTVVIDKLFTRRGDETEVTRLKNQLESILAEPVDIAAKQKGVSGLLRQIKDARIEKARVYVERKRAGAAIDRRAGLLWKIDFLLKPKVLLPVGITFILLLSGIVYALLQSTIGPSRPAQLAQAPAAVSEPETAPTPEPQAPKPEEPAKVQDAQPDTVAPSQPAPEVVPEEPGPIHIWLKTMRWPLTSHSTKDRPQYYAVILTVEDWDTKVAVCRRVANVMDKLYQGFNRVLPQDRNATDTELGEFERIAPNILNQIFKMDLIKSVDILRYGEAGFNVANRAPYCKSPEKGKRRDDPPPE